MKAFDAHLHLRDERLWPHREVFFRAMIEADITGALECACQPSEWSRHLSPPPEITLYTAYGFHPWYADQATLETYQTLATLLEANPTACVGECGLDGIRPTTPQQRRQQHDVLLAQLDLAVTYQRPVILHGARAWQALFDAVKPFIHKLPAILLHGAAFAPELLKHPLFQHREKCFFSINTSLLNPHAKTLHRLLPHLPVEQLLIETDAPDFLPHEAEPLLPNTPLQHPKHLLSVKEKLEALRHCPESSFIPAFLPLR